MKARLVFRDGYWWCIRMGVTGRGGTPSEAWADMCLLYWEAVSPRVTMCSPKVRG